MYEAQEMDAYLNELHNSGLLSAHEIADRECATVVLVELREIFAAEVADCRVINARGLGA